MPRTRRKKMVPASNLLSWTLMTALFGSSLLRISEAAKWRSFEVVWNLHSGPCRANHNVSIPVESYGILTNKEQKFYGDEIVLFYEKKLGLYPYVDKSGNVYNGGIPQVEKIA